jgi:hypothetical protein
MPKIRSETVPQGRGIERTRVEAVRFAVANTEMEGGEVTEVTKALLEFATVGRAFNVATIARASRLLAHRARSRRIPVGHRLASMQPKELLWDVAFCSGCWGFRSRLLFYSLFFTDKEADDDSVRDCESL